MWNPFRTQTPDSPQKLRIGRRMDDLELEMMEQRETSEKVLQAVKRIQGRLLKRVQQADADAAAEDTPEATNPEQLALMPTGDPKAMMRQQAALLRQRR